MTTIINDPNRTYGYRVTFDPTENIYRWERAGRSGIATSYADAVLLAFDQDFIRVITNKYGTYFRDSLDDALQRARMRVWRDMTRKDPCTGSYIMMCAIRGALKIAESKQWRQATDTDSMHAMLETPDGPVNDHPALSPALSTTPDVTGNAWIADLIGSLDAPDQQLVQLILAGYSMTEIAQAWGVPPRAMWEHKARLKARLLPQLAMG